MKIYKFYLVKKNIRHNKYPAIDPNKIHEIKNDKYACLYGYTDNKIIKDEFIEYRNMDIFRLKETNMSHNKYEKFCDTFPEEELSYSSFGTSVVENGVIKVRPVTLVTTRKEADTIHLDNDLIAEGSLYEVFDSLTKDVNVERYYDSIINFPNIFKHDIREALQYLEFVTVLFEYFSPDYSEMPFKNFSEDKLIAYVKLFGNTYKPEVL